MFTLLLDSYATATRNILCHRLHEPDLVKVMPNHASDMKLMLPPPRGFMLIVYVYGQYTFIYTYYTFIYTCIYIHVNVNNK